MKRTAYIFDVDGTLANVEPYLHYIRNSSPDFKKDFDSFHRASINSKPNLEATDMLHKAIKDGHKVIVVTSRRETWRSLTSLWLARNNLRTHGLFMRADNDYRKDYEVKKDILNSISKKWKIVHAVDDNPEVLRLWKENNIPTTKIGTWDGNRS